MAVSDTVFTVYLLAIIIDIFDTYSLYHLFINRFIANLYEIYVFLFNNSFLKLQDNAMKIKLIVGKIKTKKLLKCKSVKCLCITIFF